MNQGPIIRGSAVVFLRARVLTADPHYHDSEIRHVDRQRELCQSAAERLDAVIVGEYIEYGGTGPIAHRPALRRMLGDLATLLGVRYVLVTSLDRLARKPADAAAITEAIQQAGARILSVADLPRTHLGDLHEALLGFALADDQPQRKEVPGE